MGWLASRFADAEILQRLAKIDRHNWPWYRRRCSSVTLPSASNLSNSACVSLLLGEGARQTAPTNQRPRLRRDLQAFRGG